MTRFILAILFFVVLPDAGAQDVARGAYLARVADCASCHTAGPNAPALAGGLHMNTPIGAIVTTNITPDPEYGIGRYTLQQFSDALRRGIRGDGNRLYPAMPFASFARMSDGDIADLFAYIKQGVAPVHVRPPPTRLPFPFNQRWGLAAWDLLFVPHGPFVRRANQTASWNRGAYLVQILGHCGACHTPRGLLFEERGYDESSSHYLGGGELDHWYAPDLGANPVTGMGRRSVTDLVSLLRSGHGAGDSIYGPMVDVITQSTSKMTDADLLAIATFVKSLPLRPSGQRLPAGPATRPAIVQEVPGAAIYSGFCQRCHGPAGEGQLPKHPALAANPSVVAANSASPLRIVLEGSASPSIVHTPMPNRMPAFADTLSDRDIADVLTYVRSSWGNRAMPVSRRDAASLRATLASQAALRRARGTP